jgi:uncharacterized protein YjbI with pentapeptide repeats
MSQQQINLRHLLEKNKKIMPMMNDISINIKGYDLSDLNLSGVDLSDSDLSGVNLSGTNLSGSNLTKTKLIGADLSNADLSRIKISGANLSNANLSNANLSGANISESQLTGANLQNANLSNAYISDTFLNNVTLSNAVLSGAEISYTDLSNAVMHKAKLTFSKIYNNNMPDADLTGADLSNAEISNSNLLNAILSNTKLFAIRIYNSFLTYATIQNANLTNSKIIDSDLSYSSLIGSNFFGANLTKSIFNNANLSKVILTNVDLTDASLTDAIVSNIILSDVILTNTDINNVDFLSILPESIKLDKMISDMENRKRNKMLYMPEDENHPIDMDKMDRWIDYQCNTDAKIIATLFKTHTRYISWKKFYAACKNVFDKLYDIVKDKNYCLFTKDFFSNASFNEKSNYWMIQLLLDYYISTNRKNLPKELIVCKNINNFNKNGLCLKGDYDYYVALDDIMYSGGQMFRDAIITVNIDPLNIIVVAPFISQYAVDLHFKDKDKTYKMIIYDEVMNYWWKDKVIDCKDRKYNLNIPEDLLAFFVLMQTYFPLSREDYKLGINNFMYYFDHKIADYLSSFPTVYHLGIIPPDKSTNKDPIKTTDISVYNDAKDISDLCHVTTYLPFIKNCSNKQPIYNDINEINSKTHPENLCIEPWYKKTYQHSISGGTGIGTGTDTMYQKYLIFKNDYSNLLKL